MRLTDAIRNDYFEWLSDFVQSNSASESISYRRLLMELHHIDFRYLVPLDENRADDGISLRYRYALQSGCEDYIDCLDGPCSVLEMILALAIRCEEDIMDDPRYGDRTSQWFWQMIRNLGLYGMTDDRFDEYVVRDSIERFLDREYEPDGKGGLFRIINCKHDLRDVEIWYQLNWYLDNIAT